MEEKFISMAQSVLGEVLYDMSFVININDFHALDFRQEMRDRRELCNNLYTNHIQNATV